MSNQIEDQNKNIWIAVSDGDLDRVTELIESGISPNIKDENSYTPLHAAISWSQPEILNYLINNGGNINITDDDGDTPLFSVEDLDMCKLCIKLGGDPNIKNKHGLSASKSIEGEYPEISKYLNSIMKPIKKDDRSKQRKQTMSTTMRTIIQKETQEKEKEETEGRGEEQTPSNLIDKVKQIITESNQTEDQVDNQLRTLITQTILNHHQQQNKSNNSNSNKNGEEDDDDLNQLLNKFIGTDLFQTDPIPSLSLIREEEEEEKEDLNTTIDVIQEDNQIVFDGNNSKRRKI